VNNRDKRPNPRTATLHCATVKAPDSQRKTNGCGKLLENEVDHFLL
jgi:hypothetical protein